MLRAKPKAKLWPGLLLAVAVSVESVAVIELVKLLTELALPNGAQPLDLVDHSSCLAM